MQTLYEKTNDSKRQHSYTSSYLMDENFKYCFSSQNGAFSKAWKGGAGQKKMSVRWGEFSAMLRASMSASESAPRVVEIRKGREGYSSSVKSCKRD